MNKFQLVLISALLMVYLPTFADCPINMEYNELLDCIVVEGSDSSYPQIPATEISIDQGERE